MPSNFLASGDGEIVNPPAEDGSSDVIFLQQPFKFFGRTYNQIFVSITFLTPFKLQVIYIHIVSSEFPII